MLWSHVDKVVYLPMSQMFFLENFKLKVVKIVKNIKDKTKLG